MQTFRCIHHPPRRTNRAPRKRFTVLTAMCYLKTIACTDELDCVIAGKISPPDGVDTDLLFGPGSNNAVPTIYADL